MSKDVNSMSREAVRQKILALQKQAALEDLAARDRIRKKRQALKTPPDAAARSTCGTR